MARGRHRLFQRDPDNAYRTGLVYGRPDNETVRQAERVIAALEEDADDLYADLDRALGGGAAQ